jgi:ABC-type nickel/cobalt efflux system permease component RcnA
MQLQIFNLKTVFIAFLWGIVAVCAVTSFYYGSYIQTFGYTDSKLWIDTAFYTLMCFIAIVVVARFDKREERKRFYKKQTEILNLFENKSEYLISLTQILSKTSFSESETKGLLEHLVEKKILIPSFSEEQELIYKLTDSDSLEKYLKQVH